MRHKQKKLKVESKKLKVTGVVTLLTFAFSLSIVSAQQSINTTGGNASDSGGSISYSIGQIVYTTNTESNGSVAQGVQQPFEISVVTGIKEAIDISLSIAAYPNPVTDLLTLSAVNFDESNLSYHLYDINGKLLETKKTDGNQTTIVMRNLVPATYFLKVTDDNKEVKIFKIIKTQ